MRRRSLLTALSAGVFVPAAGCLGDELGEGDDDDTDDENDDYETDVDVDDDEWRHLQYDVGNTGVSQAPGPADGARVAWWSDTWGINTGPVVADGRVFVGTGIRNETVHAFDADTGEETWHVPIDEEIQRSLAVRDGTVYVAAGAVHAIDTEAGEEVWSEQVNTVRGLALGDDAIITASDRTSETVALEIDTGEVRWRRDVHQLDTPAVGDGLAFVAGARDLVALDIESGDTEWSIEPDRAERSPTVADGTLYLATRSGLLALEATTGEEQWTLEGNFGFSDAAVDGETLYIAGRHVENDEAVSRTLAIDVDDGAIRWTRDEPTMSSGTVVAGDDAIYVATRFRLYALDPADGDVRWWLRFQWPVGTPAIAGERLYVTVGGRLMAITPDGPVQGVWETDADPIPDRTATPPEPTDAESDFVFGSAGYDVESDADVSVDEDAPFDVSLDIEGSRIDADEAMTITLTVENRGDCALNYSTGAPLPFGILSLEADDHWLTAWTDAYEDSGHVHTAPHRGVTGVNSIALGGEIAAGETVSETYTVSNETHGIQPGTYTFSIGNTLRPATDGDEEWSFEATGGVEITEVETSDGDVIADLAIADEVPLPDEFMGAFSVEVLEPVTETHPGLIEVTLENVTDERSLIASMRRWPFGSYVGLGPDGRRLVLLSEDMYAPGFVEATDDGWWAPTLLPHDAVTRGRGTTGLDAGEVRTKRFIVTAHPETAAPQDGDAFAFEQGFGDDDVDVSWGFALAVLDHE